MSLYKQNKDFYSKPYRLTEDQKKHPLNVLEGFFNDMRLDEVRESLAGLLEVALTTDNGEFDEPDERASISFFCQRLEELIEAAYILNSKKK